MFPHLQHQLGLTVQQQQQQQQQRTVGGTKRRHCEEGGNSENIDTKSVSKRFHPMEAKEKENNGKESSKEEEEEEEESVAEEEEEDSSNGSFSDVEPNRQQQQRTTVSSGPNSQSVQMPAAYRSVQSLAGTSSLSAALIPTTAQPQYQAQNMAHVLPPQHHQLRIDLQNPYQMRPLCVDTKMMGNSEQSTNILRNLQNFYWSPQMFNAGGHFQQQQQPNYGIMQAKPVEAQNIQMMAQQQMFSFGHANPSHCAVSQFAQQMPNSGAIGHHPFGNTLTAPSHQPQQGITTILGTEMPSFDKRDESLNNDSGVGLTDRSGKGDSKNESTSTEETGNLSSAGGDEFSFSGGTSLANATASEDPKFVPFRPFIRSVSIHGVQQYHDLELIKYSETPARLALLGNTSKYPITLAEIVRRVSPPECLNTSFLSGILRRAKNKDGGKNFRTELQQFNCGVDLQTGRRKTGAITTFTALCERESVQLAKDFDKLAKDECHGFPEKELAMEMCRRAGVDSMEKQNCKHLMDSFHNASKILRDAIDFLERAIEQETGELASVTPAQMVVQQRQQQTNDAIGAEADLMNRFKRFARMSHCFGNRGMLSAWQCLLGVLNNCEFSLHQQIANNPLTESKQQKPLASAGAAFSRDLTTFPQDQGGAGSSHWMLP
ncbi:hypothetical protein niasHT_016913 [Heterodera trifolii]|uniref:Transcription factor AP-2 C-terminal domain-containing protein n=1 Tax=Heterodera trifolii TaxID=157864 RepID=A0ABD2KTQ7_9BILA